ncbi:MAG TPA: RNA polymerase sigma factor [Sphingomicrobium sp.]|nr:RNA polymerase sigma factor [Sphingomicrobium sp.]
MAALPKRDYESLDDPGLARLVAQRDPAAVRVLTMRNNQRLFRAAWSILRDREEAEDAVQSAYLKAFDAIDRFEGRSSLSTWLTRIAVNEALMRRRAAKRRRARLESLSVSVLDEYREKLMRGSNVASPDAGYGRAQIRGLLEDAVERLPVEFRLVFVLREIEGMSVEETAAALDLVEATVKTRLHRARRRLQQLLAPEVRAALEGSFPFAGADCAALTERVVAAYCRAA